MRVRIADAVQPGFFSCCFHKGVLYMGTYQDYEKKMHCYLCALQGERVVRLKEFPGESIYNIRAYDDYLILPVEQGHLYRYDIPVGAHSVIHPKHLRMGHYDFHWSEAGWVTTEKDTISYENTSILWVSGAPILKTHEYTWKECVILGHFAYLAVYFMHKRTEAGLLKVDLLSGEARLLFSERWGQFAIPGKLGTTVWLGVQLGEKGRLYRCESDSVVFTQELLHIPWRFKEIDSRFFLLASEHGWRKSGRGFVYELNQATGLFEQKGEVPDSELWDITGAGAPGKYYLVTRDEKAGNAGRVYIMEEV